MENKNLDANNCVLANSNLISIRRWCLERTLDFMKEKTDMQLGGSQDWKCQMIDCAKALSDFILTGKGAESLVGKTTCLLPASRALLDRKIALSVTAFNELMKAKGLMQGAMDEVLTEPGLVYGENQVVPHGWGPSELKPYYYDDKFDELLEVLGVKPPAKKAATTKKQSKPKK